MSWLFGDHLPPVEEDDESSEIVTLWQAVFRPMECYHTADNIELALLNEIRERLLDGGDLAIVGGLDGVTVMPTINFINLAAPRNE